MVREDAVYIHEMRSDRELMKYIREPQTSIEDSLRWQQLVSSFWTINGLGLFAVIEKHSGLFAGWNGLWTVPETGEVEIGYAIARKFWRMGFATESGKEVLDYGFATLGLERIVAVARPENAPSIRVMQKLGMQGAGSGTYYGIDMIKYEIHASATDE